LDVKPDPEVVSQLNKVTWACPSCGGPLIVSSGWKCPAEEVRFEVENGIADFLLPARKEEVHRFLSLYHEVRREENWGSEEHEYYLSLPWKDTSGRHRKIWKLRALTYELFRKDMIARHGAGPLRILDAGAGNCWLSLNLARDSHEVTAVDINTDRNDGLGVLSRLPRQAVERIYPVCAEFAHLPFPPMSFDIVVFNASLHYAKSPITAVVNALRFLRDGGSLYIMDSPTYEDPSSGETMVRSRKMDLERRFGVTEPDDFSGSYLTPALTQMLSGKNRIRTIKQRPGFADLMRRSIRRLLLGREPAYMDIIVVEPVPREEVDATAC